MTSIIGQTVNNKKNTKDGNKRKKIKIPPY